MEQRNSCEIKSFETRENELDHSLLFEMCIITVIIIILSTTCMLLISLYVFKAAIFVLKSKVNYNFSCSYIYGW